MHSKIKRSQYHLHMERDAGVISPETVHSPTEPVYNPTYSPVIKWNYRLAIAAAVLGRMVCVHDTLPKIKLKQKSSRNTNHASCSRIEGAT